MKTYAAQLDANMIVQRIIVGSPEWAGRVLGGVWVEISKHHADDLFGGIGWYWNTSTQRFDEPIVEVTDGDAESNIE